MDDPFIREHIEDLLRNIRTQVINIAGLEDRDFIFSFEDNLAGRLQFVNFSTSIDRS